MYVGVSGAFSGADFLEAMVLEPMMPQPTMLRKAVLIPGDETLLMKTGCSSKPL